MNNDEDDGIDVCCNDDGGNECDGVDGDDENFNDLFFLSFCSVSCFWPAIGYVAIATRH